MVLLSIDGFAEMDRLDHAPEEHLVQNGQGRILKK